jgi:hypothetical protein
MRLAILKSLTCVVATILKGLALAVLCCVLMATASQSEQKQQLLSAEELASRSIHRGAVEAVIWACRRSTLSACSRR